jgi:hypothetical protein
MWLCWHSLALKFCAPTDITNGYNRQSGTCWIEGLPWKRALISLLIIKSKWIKRDLLYRIRCKSERQKLGALNIVTIRNTKYVHTRLQCLCLEGHEIGERYSQAQQYSLQLYKCHRILTFYNYKQRILLRLTVPFSYFMFYWRNGMDYPNVKPRRSFLKSSYNANWFF